MTITRRQRTPRKDDPENVLSYELGFKSSWLTNNSLNIEAAIFYSDYKDFQGNYFDPLLLRGVNVNIGEAVVNGVEWDVRWAISQNFVLGFNGNVLFEAEYTELDPNVTVAEVGDTLNGVPDYNYSITADYRFNWSKSTPGFARFDHSVQGPSKDTIRNQGILPEEPEVSSLGLLNAYVGLQWDTLSFELFGRNLLDDTDSTMPALVGFDVQQRRRSFGIKLDYEF